MSFDRDPNEQANISAADLAMLVDERNELLEALKEIVECYGVEDGWVSDASINKAHAAIAKTEGKK